MEPAFILIDCIGRGGAEKIAVVLANELEVQGHEVHLLILRRNVGYDLSPRVKLHVMSDLQFAKGYGYSILEMLRGLWWVRQILKEQRHHGRSVLVSHLTRCNVINVALEFCLPRHRAVCVSHNSIGFYRNKGLVKRLLLSLQKWIFPLAYRTVCVSRRMAVDYRQLWAYRKESVVTIYNPIVLPPFLPSEQRQDDTSSLHIAMVGRLHPVKRHDLALQAMAILKDRGSRRYILHLLGDGPNEQQVRKMIEELGLSDHVVVHGWIEDTPSFVRQCAMSLLCSDSEGFPNSIVESLSVGVPVVSTDCVSGPRELLAPDQDLRAAIPFSGGFFPARHGTLVRLNDARALADAIECQASRLSPDCARECAEFARQYDASAAAKKYGELLSTRTSPA